MAKKFNEMSFKDKIAYITCISSFILGWLITWVGFIVNPLGEVSNGVLWILGQSLLYCASVLGIGMYVTKSMRHMRHELGLNEIEESEE